MVTTLALVGAVLVVLVLVAMFVQLCRGCLVATCWWWFGGAETMFGLLGACFAAIAEGFTGNG
jgi:hypothetical protein